LLLASQHTRDRAPILEQGLRPELFAGRLLTQLKTVILIDAEAGDASAPRNEAFARRAAQGFCSLPHERRRTFEKRGIPSFSVASQARIVTRDAPSLSDVSKRCDEILF
jgi:hypothetical protein